MWEKERREEENRQKEEEKVVESSGEYQKIEGTFEESPPKKRVLGLK